MGFIKVKNFKGLVWSPEEGGERKHDCPDCYSCQMCGDDRCELCLKRACSECKKDNDSGGDKK